MEIKNPINYLILFKEKADYKRIKRIASYKMGTHADATSCLVRL